MENKLGSTLNTNGEQEIPVHQMHLLTNQEGFGHSIRRLGDSQVGMNLNEGIGSPPTIDLNRKSTQENNYHTAPSNNYRDFMNGNPRVLASRGSRATNSKFFLIFSTFAIDLFEFGIELNFLQEKSGKIEDNLC